MALATFAIVVDFSLTNEIAFFCSPSLFSSSEIFSFSKFVCKDFPFSIKISENKVSNHSIKLETLLQFFRSSLPSEIG